MDRRHPGRAAGFTLTELVITIGVAAILTTVAVPSFTSLVASQRAKTAASELFTAMFNARAQAIARNASVTISQNGGDWAQGWQIKDESGTLLDEHGPLSGVRFADAAPAAVKFRPSGRVQAGAAPSLVITTGSGSSTHYQCISVDLSGRPYIQSGQTC